MTGLLVKTHCRACHGQIDPILSLGSLYLSTFLKKDDPLPPRVPLDLMACRQCELVQLRHTVQADRMFRKYWYRSGTNETMREELSDIIFTALSYVGKLTPDDAVIDIGANDGTLLKTYAYQNLHPLRIAFEPAFNLNEELRPHAEILVPDYFPGDLTGAQRQAKIITSIAMFYDLDDPHSFLEAIADILDRHGVWICQFQDLWGMLESTAYDNIVHEHLCYYSLKTFRALLAQHGLVLMNAEWRAINGGSLRFIVGHAGAREATGTIDALLKREEGLTWDRLLRFAWQVEQQKTQLRSVMEVAAAMGPVDLYAASTKAQTLIQVCDLTSQLRCAVERTPQKVGLRTVTGLPIVSEAYWRTQDPKQALIGAWQFRDAFYQREMGFLNDGGAFLVPLPHVEVVSRGR